MKLLRLTFAIVIVGCAACAHYPKITPETAVEPVVYELTRGAWFGDDGAFEAGPRFAPVLQTEDGPPPHMAVRSISPGSRLEFVGAYRLQYRDGPPEIWAIATTAEPDDCGLFVAIPWKMLGERPGRHPWFPSQALRPVPDAESRFDAAQYRCAAARWDDLDFTRWIPAPR